MPLTEVCPKCLAVNNTRVKCLCDLFSMENKFGTTKCQSFRSGRCTKVYSTILRKTPARLSRNILESDEQRMLVAQKRSSHSKDKLQSAKDRLDYPWPKKGFRIQG